MVATDKQQASPLWTTTTSEVRLTGTWREAKPDYHVAPSPCHGACPVQGDIASWIQQVSRSEYYGAWLTLMENNPFPAIAGRICHHPCETACNRQQLDETVGICSLERFVGDMALTQSWALPAIKQDDDCSVAIVGGGPAGLSCAYQLRRRGFKVALYEARDQLGGLMRYGIPSYRLDRAILDAEIERIIDLGIDLHLEVELQDQAALKRLHKEYDAVYLATGASQSKNLPMLDYQQPWVLDSAAFLAAMSHGQNMLLGERILVIGGGSAAIDTARSARRLGKAVTILALEPEHLLPAQTIEVTEALEEGVEFVCGAMMQSTQVKDKGVQLHCVKVDFSAGAERGEFAIDVLTGSEFNLVADTVIPAIGQQVDMDRWAGLLAADQGLAQTDQGWQTSCRGIFAGGDMASMDRFVTHAVGMGKQAAQAISHYLRPHTEVAQVKTEKPVGFEAINSYYYPISKRQKQKQTELETRLDGFSEVQQALSDHGAMIEAGRCFSCGTCTYCDNCFYHCPDMAITKLATSEIDGSPNRAQSGPSRGIGYSIKSDYCKGCGLCVAECPTGSIIMREDSGCSTKQESCS